MDALGTLTSGPDVALVVLAFLQADCKSSDFRKELASLGHEIRQTRDINCNGPGRDAPEDGDLETDGHLSYCLEAQMGDIRPSVDLQRLGNHAEVAAIQRVAEELREIAAQLEHNVVARATQNLSRNISDSSSERWTDLLSREVDRLMRQGVGLGLEHLPQERVLVALTLTLVKGVCERAPQLVRNLFRTALQSISSVRAR